MTITIFTLPTCPKCKVIKTKLERKGISFNENQDIEYMKTLGISGAPALQVGDKLMTNITEINNYVNGL